MKKRTRFIFFAAAVVAFAATAAIVWPSGVKTAPNGIAFPVDYKEWRLIAPSHRTDKNHIRVILGNDVAIGAARSGRTNPWPDGAVLGKLVWKDKSDPDWPTATVPGDFVHAEFMFKDAKRYASTGGWGFARWVGMDLKPYGDEPGFVQECFACHTPVAYNDYVFTRFVQLP